MLKRSKSVVDDLMSETFPIEEFNAEDTETPAMTVGEYMWGIFCDLEDVPVEDEQAKNFFLEKHRGKADKVVLSELSIIEELLEK